jgi:hypothetical protein
MKTPPPPVPFPGSNTHVLRAGTTLHRVHDRRFGSCTFNPGLGRPSRFAPLKLAGGPIPTQYVATTFECAVSETIFHDVPLTASNKTVGADNIKPLGHSIVEPLRDLTLVPLFVPDLARWNVSRAELIDTEADRYHVTAQWALAIHQSRADVDGLIWTSKRGDPDLSLILFGDRLAETDLLAHSMTPIYATISEMEQVQQFADRATITIVL